jgi:hypothetical protein
LAAVLAARATNDTASPPHNDRKCRLRATFSFFLFSGLLLLPAQNTDRDTYTITTCSSKEDYYTYFTCHHVFGNNDQYHQEQVWL